jgi:hypothetical protein
VAEESTETVLPANGRNRRVSRWHPLDVFEAVQDEMDGFWRQLGLEHQDRKGPGSPRRLARDGVVPTHRAEQGVGTFYRQLTLSFEAADQMPQRIPVS